MMRSGCGVCRNPPRSGREIELHVCVADAEEVPVTLDETRDGQHPVEVDHLRARADNLI